MLSSLQLHAIHYLMLADPELLYTSALGVCSPSVAHGGRLAVCSAWGECRGIGIGLGAACAPQTHQGAMSSLSGNVLAFETLGTRGCKAREDVSCPELLSQTRLECLVYTMQIVKGTSLQPSPPPPTTTDAATCAATFLATSFATSCAISRTWSARSAPAAPPSSSHSSSSHVSPWRRTLCSSCDGGRRYGSSTDVARVRATLVQRRTTRLSSGSSTAVCVRCDAHQQKWVSHTSTASS